MNATATFLSRRDSRAQEDLARFRWHTGAEPTPVRKDETVPILFRDIGPEAIARLLRGGLRRLAGPMTPITYLRTADYREPYTDYAAIGRLVLLRPREIEPWHSGIPHIFIAAASRMPSEESFGFVPGKIALGTAARVLAGTETVGDLRDAFGGREYDEIQRESLSELDRLIKECHLIESLAVPLRIVFQTGTTSEQMRLAAELERYGLDETDLCTAWHHLPTARRALMKAVVPEIALANAKNS
jgi:hypothetical protein